MRPLAPRPANEIQRLAVLHELSLFGDDDDLIYRRKVDIMRRVFRVPIALLALADEHEQRFKVVFGLPMRSVARDLAICSHALVPPYPPLIIPDTTQDPRSKDSPMVTGELGIRFYAGVPLVLDGEFAVGTLCIMDTAPRTLDADEIQLLADFALQLAAVMQARLDYRRMLIQANQLREQAERANQSKSQFLSSMSHELRTPLNAVLGFAQLMSASRREPLTDKQRGFVAQILKSGQYLLTLISDVLNLAKIEAGEVTLSPEPLDLAALTQETAVMVQDAAHAQQITLELSVDTPLWVCADHTRARQILLNLLSNAIKYNRPQGRITVSVLPARRSENGLALVGLAVKDTGLGIPKDKQHRLFRAFERLGRENSAIEGTGIGLMITKQLVELMRGELGFESIEQEGSTFFLWLPAHQPVQQEDCGSARTASEEPERAHSTPRSATSALRVLYIEDNAANRTLMQEIADDRGDIALALAADGEQGLELALTLAPDLILMDINLPGISGQQAAAKLKKWGDTRHVPIVALSADATAPSRQHAEHSELFDRYLTKPFNLDDINALFDEQIANQPS